MLIFTVLYSWFNSYFLPLAAALEEKLQILLHSICGASFIALHDLELKNPYVYLTGVLGK